MRLLLLAAACLLVAGVAGHGRYAVADERGFVDRAERAAARADVRDELAYRVQDRVLTAHPELGGGEAVVRAAVDDTVYRDPRFMPAFRDGAARMHGALFDSDRPPVELVIPGEGRMLRDALTARLPALAGRLPASDDPPPLVTLAGGGPFERALRVAAPAAGRVAAWWPAAVALALVVLALTVARAPTRRGGLRRAGAAVAIAGAAAVALTAGAELALLRTFTTAHGAAVVDAIWDSYLADLRTWGLVAAAAGLAFAAATLTARSGRRRAPVTH